MKYQIVIRETICHYVDVVAPNEDAAWNFVVDNYLDDYTYEAETGFKTDFKHCGWEPIDIYRVD